MTDHTIADADGSGRGDLTPPSRTRTPVAYDGGDRDLLKIAIVNTLLTILTLGIYRFWAKTRLRRFLWSHVSFHGERLEYSGLAKELFIGFLVAVAIVLPIMIVYGVAEFLLAENHPLLSVAAQLIYAFVLAFLISVAIYRARRYRLSRTQWRGIRGGQSGSAFRYAVLNTVYGLVSLITFGLAFPLMRVALYRYRTANTWFGDQRFAFEGGTRELIRPWLLVWAFGVLPGIAFLILSPVLMTFDEQTNELVAGNMYVFLLLLVIPIGLGLYPLYRAAEIRYFAERTSVAGLGFVSTIRGRDILFVFVLYAAALAALFVAIGLLLFAVSAAVAQSVEPGAGAGQIGLWQLLLIALPITLIVFGGVLSTFFLTHRMLGVMCRHLTVLGDADFDAIAQSSKDKPVRGEGFADMLDVDGL